MRNHSTSARRKLRATSCLGKRITAAAFILALGGLVLVQSSTVTAPSGRPSGNRPSSLRTAATSSASWLSLLYHDSYQSFYRAPFGADPTGQPILLRLVGSAGLTSAQILLTNVNGNVNKTATIPMKQAPLAMLQGEVGKARAAGLTLWEGSIPAVDLQTPCVLGYQFAVHHGKQVAYYGNNEMGYGGVGSVYPSAFEVVDYHVTVYDRAFTTPNWLVHGLIYEIFPDRFYNGNHANDENPRTQMAIGQSPSGAETLVPIQFHKNWYSTPYDPNIVVNPKSPHAAQERALRGNGNWSTDFFGGDLRGIEDKLGYLQSLGVNTLYLTPIFQAESNHKYDTGNFMKIDPGFGTLKTYMSLIKAAKARHMHIILDGVFEDTGSDSLYFNRFGSYKSVGAWQQYMNHKVSSPYYNWYQWTPGANPPYASWAGYDTLPLANTAGRPWQQFVYGKWDPRQPTNPATNSVARYWVAMGSSGWRLDSADNSNFSVAWWSAFRKAVKQVDPNAAIIGEDWNDPTNDNGTDWLTGTTWDSTMNYPFRNAAISFFRGNYNDGNVQNYAMNASAFGSTLMQMIEEYPKPAMYAEMNLFGSQDTERILTILEGAPDAPNLTAFQQATWQPTAAQKAAGIRKLELASTFQYGFVGVPMIYYGDEAGMIGYKDPLDRGAYPWGRVDQPLIDFYRKLGAIRNSHPVLQSGDYQQLYAKGETLAFARTIRNGRDALGAPAKNATALVAVNNGPAKTIQLAVSALVPNGSVFYDALHGNRAYTVKNGVLTIALGAVQGAMLFAGK